eukprot:21161-Heterococcus_DN1.PRE.4
MTFLLLLITTQAQHNCVQLKKRHFDISTVQDAAELTAAAACRGNSLTATWYGEVFLADTITVGNNTSLTITAASTAAATIDGNSTTQLFLVNGDLTIAGVTLQNGYTRAQGGAINAVASASITLKNCTLIKHRALYGAAISIFEGTLQIDGSSFSFNDAAEAGSSIQATGATLNISSSVFMNESNSAVYLEASTVTTLNSTFSNNTAEQGAGLVCFKGTTAYISGCLFDSNQADSQAGAISVVTQSQLIASDTVFSSNTAGAASGAIGTYDGSSAEFTNCQFLNNSAQGGGGALTCNHALCDDHMASNCKSIIRLKQIAARTLIQSSSLVLPVLMAVFDGGAMTIGTQQCVITDTVYSKNTAQGSAGAIRLDSGNITISNSLLTANRADSGQYASGGAMYIADGCNSTLISTIFSHNSASGGSGGAISISSDTYITGCTFDNNAAAYGGAIRYGLTGILTADNTEYLNNVATTA